MKKTLVRTAIPGMAALWMLALGISGDAQSRAIPGSPAAVAPGAQPAGAAAPAPAARQATPRQVTPAPTPAAQTPVPTAAQTAAQTPVQTAARTAAVPAPDPALMTQYCVTCHNQRMKTGGLALDTVDLDHVAADADTWEKVVRKIKTGLMPPTGARRPERAALDTFVARLEHRLDQAAPAGASLDSPALHRLNRTEYGNAIRDLLALEINVAPLLPPDGSGEGFDNIAAALGVSPSLIQGYVGAAMKISRLAVGDRTLVPSQVTYAAPPGLAQDRHIEGLPLGTRGGMLVKHTFPLDAQYEFSVGGGGQGGPGATVDITIDGVKVPAVNTRRFTLPLTAGPHTIGVAIVDRTRPAGVDDVYSDFRVDGAFIPGGGVQNVAITGPINPTGVGDTPSRRRIFVCTPVKAEDEPACARKVLTTIARRAYRGPVTEAEIATLMDFYTQGRTGGDFESGIQRALARVLVAPRFIYRAEEEPQRLAAGASYRVSDIDLASRLSFFLWSSIPDDELLDLAAKGQLRDPAVLRRQVKRMLGDPKAHALVKNFAGQWLYLRELGNVQTEAKNFDDNLRASFLKESELLFETIIREDRSILELLDADYTFVDERLARHYGMPDVRGTYFRRIALEPSSPRRGLIGQGSFLTVTSIATRTSPVSRGKWVLENMLGAPPPEPPAGVETNLDTDPAAVKVTTLRQRLELHRASPQCASCHRLMDPIGFSLENFDLVGTWREKDGPAAIDATGQLPDGTPLNGATDLRKALLGRSEAFVTTAATKMMTYALGRPIEPAHDMPTIRGMVRRVQAEQNRFSALVLGVVESAPFQRRVKKPVEIKKPAEVTHTATTARR